MGLSTVTANRHRSYVARFLDMLEDRQWQLDEIQENDFRELLVGKSAAVESGYLVSLKYFCHYLHVNNELSTPITLFENISPAKITHTEHPFYTPAQIELMLSLPDTSTLLGLRDRTILQLLYDTGMRNSELRQLLVNDIDLTQHVVRVTGKRQKERLIPLTAASVQWLEQWLLRRTEMVINKSPYLFLPRLKKNLCSEQISSNTLWEIIKKYANRAGLGKQFTVHSLRHAFASHMLENGANLRVVQSLLGHSSLDATQIYLQVRFSCLKELHRKFHPRGG